MKIMTDKEFEKLKTGDVVRHVNHSEIYIVTSNYGNRVTAATTVDMTNPCEWVKVKSK